MRFYSFEVGSIKCIFKELSKSQNTGIPDNRFWGKIIYEHNIYYGHTTIIPEKKYCKKITKIEVVKYQLLGWDKYYNKVI